MIQKTVLKVSTLMFCLILIISGVILQESIFPDNSVIYKNQKNVIGLYTLSVDKELVKDSNKVELWISNIKERQNQKDFSYCIIDPFPKMVSKDENGNEILFWEFDIPKEDINIKIEFRCSAYETYSTIDPQKLGSYTKNEDYYRLIKEEGYIQFTPELKLLAKNIIGEEKNPYLQAKLVYDWMINNMSRRSINTSLGGFSMERGTSVTLREMSGDCGEYASTFVAFCRYLGIPARQVIGSHSIYINPEIHNGYKKITLGNHIWAEVFFPKYGWIPVDPLAGQDLILKPDFVSAYFEVPKDPDFYYGNLDNKRIIYGKGNSIILYPLPSSPPFKIMYMQPYYFLIDGKRASVEDLLRYVDSALWIKINNTEPVQEIHSI
jgi:hypothetical protein